MAGKTLNKKKKSNCTVSPFLQRTHRRFCDQLIRQVVRVQYQGKQIYLFMSHIGMTEKNVETSHKVHLSLNFFPLRTDTGGLGSIYEILNYSATTVAILLQYVPSERLFFSLSNDIKLKTFK